MRRTGYLLCIGGVLSGLLLSSVNISLAEDLIIKADEKKSDEGYESYLNAMFEVQKGGCIRRTKYTFKVRYLTGQARLILVSI